MVGGLGLMGWGRICSGIPVVDWEGGGGGGVGDGQHSLRYYFRGTRGGGGLDTGSIRYGIM